MNDEDGSPGFHIANLGFDVYVHNSRGNKYSLYHTNPDITNAEFFDFSFQEMALYDVKAAFEYV